MAEQPAPSLLFITSIFIFLLETTIADQQTPKPVPIDPYKILNVTLNPDGSLTRPMNVPDIPPSYNAFDIPLNSLKKTWMRIFKPPNLSPNVKLPLIIYFHGGGFVLYNPSSRTFHYSCVQLAAGLPAIILSVDYRLAPEYKLPSAYEDAVDALFWVKSKALKTEAAFKVFKFVDFGKCFLMGSSSGANIVYQVGLRSLGLDLGPVKISGLIINQPFIGGVERTASEMRLEFDKVVPLAVADLMWEFSLPVGVDRDHEYCNPMRGSHRDEIKRLPKCFVRGYGGDPLVDRQMEFVKMMEDNGASVTKYFFEDGFHGCELALPEKAQALLVDVRNFIYSNETTALAPTRTAQRPFPGSVPDPDLI